jgi:eukaryotic-like serine/threonine-protein kinase
MSEGQATATKSGAPDPLLGRVIADRFKITSLIARGGMGKVYRAEQAPLGRACAVKVLNPNYNGDADPEFHRRFYREASISSKINHPNSVTIFDYGKTDDEIYYIAMEYLEGQTLHHALRSEGTFTEERAGRVAQQICRALREAHALGVIHRDLKPANIFLTRHGDDGDFVKVLDFGLVKQLGERPEEQLTQTGLFMGSPKYMAPEQIQGAVVDARTDIYSLGIILYEMLAGKVPFDRATSVNILMAHVGEPPPPMREVNPNLLCTPTFEELVMRCIAKDPNERFTTMDEVLQALKSAHGVSMTGQLAAVHVSGAYGSIPPAMASVTPSAMRSNYPSSAAPSASVQTVPPPPSVSAQLTPMGMLRTGSANDVLGTGDFQARPRSKAWIVLGVLVAAAIGGGLGMVAFRITAPAAPDAKPATSTAASPATTPSASVATATSPTPTPASVATSTIHVVTEPSGAVVRDDTMELCSATPCDVAFKGDLADPHRLHKLTITKPGYRIENRTVKSTDSPVHLKLAKIPGAIVRPAGGTVTPKASSDNVQTQPGFKDVPY